MNPPKPLVKHSRAFGFWYVILGGTWPERELFATLPEAHDYACHIASRQRRAGKESAWR